MGLLFGHEVFIKVSPPHSLTEHDSEGIKKLATNWLEAAFTKDEMLARLREKYPKIYEELNLS